MNTRRATEARGGVLEQYVEHADRAQRSRHGLPTSRSWVLVRNVGLGHRDALHLAQRRARARRILGLENRPCRGPVPLPYLVGTPYTLVPPRKLPPGVSSRI